MDKINFKLEYLAGVEALIDKTNELIEKYNELRENYLDLSKMFRIHLGEKFPK